MRPVATILLLLSASVALAQTRLVPLTDMDTAVYQGLPGGLYPDGANAPPAEHRAAGLAAAARVLPRNASGEIDTVSGRIVLLSIGMSNATQEFSAFRGLSDADTNRSPRLILVDGAQGGQTASIIQHDTATFWRVVADRLAAAGVTPLQVQVVWLKEANANPRGSFPGHADTLSSQLQRIVRILRTRYPNLALTFLSSRTFGGYATTTLNPEPYAYESGFAVKWLIERQIAGDPELAMTGPEPRASWLGWGPYLWANGTEARSDGLTWVRDDFGPDGTHPSTAGRQKVAAMLLRFFSTDSLASSWYLRKPWERPSLPAPGLTQLLLPADSARVPFAELTLAWRPAAPSVDRYLLEIAEVGGPYRFSDSSVAGTSRPWLPPQPGTYRWRVRAHNATGWGPISQPRTYTVDAPSSVELRRGGPSRLDLH